VQNTGVLSNILTIMGRSGSTFHRKSTFHGRRKLRRFSVSTQKELRVKDVNFKSLICRADFFLGSFIEHKRCSITWHYRLADPDFGSFQAKECQNHLENAILSKLPVEVMIGKKNLEVRGHCLFRVPARKLCH
jgi:trehalose-phosphatase